MKIKEQDSQRMMISSSFLGLDDPISTKFVLDKLSQTITVERRYFWLIKREYVIPFSTVRSVRIDYKQKTVGGGLGGASKVDAWEIFVHINKIAQSTNKAKMLRLANEISRFIGCELIDNSAKPESSFQRFLHRPMGKGFFRSVFPPGQKHPDASAPKVSGEEAADKRRKRIEQEAAREDAVARWKKRMEQDAAERKK